MSEWYYLYNLRVCALLNSSLNWCGIDSSTVPLLTNPDAPLLSCGSTRLEHPRPLDPNLGRRLLPIVYTMSDRWWVDITGNIPSLCATWTDRRTVFLYAPPSPPVTQNIHIWVQVSTFALFGTVFIYVHISFENLILQIEEKLSKSIFVHTGTSIYSLTRGITYMSCDNQSVVVIIL